MQDFDLEGALPYLLNRAGVGIGEAFSEELVRFDTTLPMWRVLASLLHRDGQRITGLSAHVSIEVSTLSRLVAGMERRGFLRRSAADDDARAVVVRLTDEGRALAWRIVPLAELYERMALANISAADAALLKRLLAQIYSNIASLGPRAHAIAAEKQL